ncbi:phosphocholine cytidylyltransferase family protein [Candidatus Pacearchaeota archaeon]|nr:phosphocholine cytidylyltransferase family protein [Candidatus Pacearchaeota archaeon]
MKALLLTAGKGTRLKGYTENTPKSLLEVNNKPVLFHIMDRILANGITDFIVIVGFQKEKIIGLLKEKYPNINFKFIENSIFEKTNTLYSLYLAKDELKNEDFVYFHGDVLFNKNILKKLLDPKHKNAAIVEAHKESMQAFGFDDIITRISKKKDALGKALGIYKFSKEASEKLFEEAEKVILSGDLNAFQSEAINPTIITHKMNLVSTGNLGWFEVDEEDDLIEAERVLNQILKEESRENVRNMWI